MTLSNAAQATLSLHTMGANYALRAHLVLDAIQTEPLGKVHAGELALYLEIAWRAARQHFKSPPVRLANARKAIEALLQQHVLLAQPVEVNPALWEVIRDGVVCADGVWERLPRKAILAAMQQLRTAAFEKAA